MSSRMLIDEKMLDQVNGGLLTFYKSAAVVEYLRADNTTVKYQILDFDNAWKRCKTLEIDFTPEDDIIADLLSKGYIA